MRLPRTLAALALAALAVAGLAFGARVGGTARGDVLRGTARADRISGGKGNDKLLGLGGNDVLVGGRGRDVLNGGPGNDRLSSRDGERDTLICGPGRDTVLGDQLDTVRRDCEVVQRKRVTPPKPPKPVVPPPVDEPPPPAEPPPPPPPTTVDVAAGSYKGATSTGNYVFFDITPQRTAKGFRVNDFRLTCDGDLIVYGPFGNVTYELPIDAAGKFALDFSGDSSFVDGTPTKLTIRVTGSVQGSNATGTAYVAQEFDYEGRHYRCATEVQSWTASRQ